MTQFEKTARETLDSIYRADDAISDAIAAKPVDLSRVRLAMIQLRQVIELAQFVTGTHPTRIPVGLLRSAMSA